ncbi:MAG: ferric reductase-like transmembrane domain-containing protein [Acidobacteria bacterium]|nr:ferric reductase-like transmembrane domain-containing protein [Acidobacteriota bacterium]
MCAHSRRTMSSASAELRPASGCSRSHVSNRDPRSRNVNEHDGQSSRYALASLSNARLPSTASRPGKSSISETIGFAAFLVMLPLAVTSTAGWIRRLGGRRWQLLHRLVYASVVAGVVHYYWLVKSDVRLPLLYASVAAILLLYRAAAWTKKTLPRQPDQARPALLKETGPNSQRYIETLSAR